MNPDEITAELRASAPPAPDHLRDRVRTITAAEGARRRPALGRRNLSIALAGVLVLAAVGAALVQGFGSGGSGGKKAAATAELGKAFRNGPAVTAAGTVPTAVNQPAGSGVVHGVPAPLPSQSFSTDQATAIQRQAAAGKAKALAQADAALAPSQLPPAGLRLQNYDVSLGIAVKNPAALSKATVQAMRWTRAFGGYVSRVSYATPSGRKGEADLLLRVPVGKVQDALQRFSALGTLTSQHVSIQDLQGTVNAQTKRIIQLNRRIGAILEALSKQQLTVDQQARLQGELTARKQELAAVTGAKQTTVREGRLAHVYLNLHTAAAKHRKAVAPPAKPGRIERKLDAAGRVLAQELAVLLYALVILAPFILLAAFGVAAARAARRRTDRRLLARS